jgi:hypothetical protein
VVKAPAEAAALQRDSKKKAICVIGGICGFFFPRAV